MASMASQNNAQQFQQAGLELAQMISAKTGVDPRAIIQDGSQAITASGVCDGMVLRSGFCKPSRGGKRARKKGGACTRKLSKTIAALVVLLEITGAGALIYTIAPLESVALVSAVHTWVQINMQGFLSGLVTAVKMQSTEIIALLWGVGVTYFGNSKMVGTLIRPFSEAMGQHFTFLCAKVEEYLSSPEAEQKVAAAAAAGVDVTDTAAAVTDTSSGGARRRRTYKKRGGSRRGGARGSCGMSGGKKRKSRRGRKSRGRKSRGRKSRGRKSRVHRKRRGHKSKKH